MTDDQQGSILSTSGIIMYISGKLHTYPSPEATFYPKWEVSVNVDLGEG